MEPIRARGPWSWKVSRACMLSLDSGFVPRLGVSCSTPHHLVLLSQCINWSSRAVNRSRLSLCTAVWLSRYTAQCRFFTVLGLSGGAAGTSRGCLTIGFGAAGGLRCLFGAGRRLGGGVSGSDSDSDEPADSVGGGSGWAGSGWADWAGSCSAGSCSADWMGSPSASTGSGFGRFFDPTGLPRFFATARGISSPAGIKAIGIYSSFYFLIETQLEGYPATAQVYNIPQVVRELKVYVPQCKASW